MAAVWNPKNQISFSGPEKPRNVLLHKSLR